MAEAGRIIGTFAANTKVQIAKVNAAFAGFQNIKGLSGITAGITLVAAALTLSIGPAIAFEKAFANVEKTVEGTPEQLAQVRSEILDMSRSMPLAATAIAEVAATAGQLGVATSDISQFTEVMVMLGTATDLTADQAATSMARFTNIMQIPIRDLPLLSAALVHLGNNSAATESEILTLGLRLAAAGTQLGLSGAQVLATSAAMKSLGITAEVGGSALSRVMIEIATASGPKLETFARIIGVTNDEFRKLVAERSPEAAGKLMLGFVEGLQAIDERGGSVRAQLQALGFDSIRLRDVIIRLVAGGTELKDALALVADESVYGGALLQEYGRFAETTAARIEILKNRIRGLAIDLGTPLLGGVVTLVDGIGDAILKLSSALAPLGREVAELVANIVTGFGQIAQALGIGNAATLLVASLALLAAAAAEVLSVVNDLPPPLIAAGAAMIALSRVTVVTTALSALVPLLSAAGTAALSFATQVSAGTVTMGTAAAGMRTLAVSATAATTGFLAAAGPAIALTAVVVLLGKTFIEASRAADEAGRTIRDGLNASLASGDWGAYRDGVQSTEAELRRLGGELGVGEGAWRKFTTSARGALETLSPMENSVANNIAKFRELEDVLRENETFDSRIALLAEHFGATEQAIYNAVAATNTFDLASRKGSVSLSELTTAVGGYLEGLDAIGVASGMTGAEIADMGASVERLALTLGVSTDSILTAAAAAGIAIEDLSDPTKISDVEEELGKLTDGWLAVADATGMSSDAVREEWALTQQLIGSYSELKKAIDGVNAAREAAQFQTDNLEAQATALAKVTDEFLAGTASVEDYAEAVYNFEVAFAASGAPIEAVTAQLAKTKDEFIENARSMGVAETAINSLLFEWVLLSTTEAATLQVEGEDTLRAAQDRVMALRQELTLPIIAKIAADTGRTEEQIIALLDRGNTWANSLFEAEMAAATESAFEQIARILVEAGIWDATEAEAFLTANASQADETMGRVQGDFDTFKDGIYEGSITARDNASSVIAVPQANADKFKGGIYEGSITARDNASTTIAIPQRNANTFKDGIYQGSITARDNASSTIKVPQDNANKYRSGSPYNATLQAQTSQANAAISGTINLLAGFKSKTITLGVSVSASASNAAGAVARAAPPGFRLAEGGLVQPVRSYADGGREIHNAMIAAGRWPARIWAEPETGGEAYIPLAGAKRARSTMILADVANRFGYGLVPMADGGTLGLRDLMNTLTRGDQSGARSVQHTINIAAPINVTLEGGDGRLDPQVVAAEVRRGVDRVLARAARDITNNIR